MTADTSRKYYLLTTDVDPIPRIAGFTSLFPDGLEAGTTSEVVAALAPADLYHAGTWAVVACDLAILDDARDADDILADVYGVPASQANDETLAAAYLAHHRANRERALLAAAIRKLRLGHDVQAAADVRGAAEQLEQLGMFAEQLELQPGFLPRAQARAQTVGKLRALADRLEPALTMREPAAVRLQAPSDKEVDDLAHLADMIDNFMFNRSESARRIRAIVDRIRNMADPPPPPPDLPAIVEPPRDEAALAALAHRLDGAAPSEVEIDALDVDGLLVAVLRWNGSGWAGHVTGRAGEARPMMRRIASFRVIRSGATATTVQARDLGWAGPDVDSRDTIELRFDLETVDGGTWPPAAGRRVRFPAIAEAAVRTAGPPSIPSGDFAIGDDRGGAGDRCEVGNGCGRLGCPECQA